MGCTGSKQLNGGGKDSNERQSKQLKKITIMNDKRYKSFKDHHDLKTQNMYFNNSDSSTTLDDCIDYSDELDQIHSKSGLTSIGDNPDMGAIADRYTKIRKLGNGPFGEVIIAREKATGNIKAIKIIKKSLMIRSGDNGQVVELLRELEVVRALDHPNIMALYPLYQDKRNFYIVIDHYTGGDLLDLLCHKMRFHDSEASFIIEQVFTGVRYLHSNGVVHRDLKAENIFFDRPFDVSSPLVPTGVDNAKKPVLRRSTTNRIKQDDVEDRPIVKIVDFGLACKIDRRHGESNGESFPLNERIGTSYYIAPEVLTKRYNEKCDIWSCGVLLYLLLTGYPPFTGDDEDEIIDNIVKGKYRWYDLENEVVSKEARNLVDCMLRYNPEERFSATECLEHRWLQQYRLPAVVSSCASALKNMALFQRSDKLARLSILFMGQMLTTVGDTRPLARAFVNLDLNGDGRIDRWELYRGFLLYCDSDSSKSNIPKVEELKRQYPMATEASERMEINKNKSKRLKQRRRKQRLGLSLSEEDEETQIRERWSLVDSVIESVDFDRNGFIEYSEFVTVALERKKLMSHGTLQAAFNWIDLDGSGTIAADELMGMLPRVTDEEWLAILKQVDVNGDGEVDFEEFKVMMANFILHD